MKNSGFFNNFQFVRIYQYEYEGITRTDPKRVGIRGHEEVDVLYSVIRQTDCLLITHLNQEKSLLFDWEEICD